MGAGRVERRVQVLSSEFTSYYDAAFHSLASDRAAYERHVLNLPTDGRWRAPGPRGNHTTALRDLLRRRRQHTLAAIDTTEAPLMNAAVTAFLRTFNSSDTSRPRDCAGVDWYDLSQVTADRYGLPLRQLLHLVATPPPPSANSSNAHTFLAQARSKSHALVMPFMEYPRAPGNRSALARSDWTLEWPRGHQTFSRCTYSDTRLSYTAEGALRDDVGRPEQVLTEAIEEVLAAICSVIIQLGFEIEYEWLSRWNTPNEAAPSPSSASVIGPARVWQRPLEELLAWRGWTADEVRRDQLCSVDECCNIPMWPLMFMGAGGPRRRPPRRPGHGTGPAPANDGRPSYPYGSSPPDQRPPPSFPQVDEDLWSPRCMAIRG